MVTNNKNVFWQALVFTVLVFGIGILLGFFLENLRQDTIRVNLEKSELNLLDEQLRNRALESLNANCAISTKSTFDFADKIYQEAYQLEKYDSASKLTDDLKETHKRYDLLRMFVWFEAINIKKNCSNDFHTIVYFYQYDTQDIDVRARQTTFSRLLVDLKNKYPDEILLIPIAADLDLESVNLALDIYDLKEVPIIVVDEEVKIDEIISFNELSNIVFKSHKA